MADNSPRSGNEPLYTRATHILDRFVVKNLVAKAMPER
jgi:hypothetical protein